MSQSPVNLLVRCPGRPRSRSRKTRSGVILMITMVILVILATLGYTLTARVVARRHRDQYVIDYCQARYACASALKSALTTVSGLQTQLISRPNEPDFSDLFAMSEVDYQKYMAQFAEQQKASRAEDSGDDDPNDRTVRATDGKKDKRSDSKTSAKKRSDAKAKMKKRGTRTSDDVNAYDINDVNDVNDLGSPLDEIPGPYGPRWPLVAEPVECEIGSAKVQIEIEDENAKYPLNWALISDEKWQPLAETSFETFCEWMGYAPTEITDLKTDLGQIAKLRPFQLEFKPATKATDSKLATSKPTNTDPPAALRSRVSRGSSTAASSAAARRSLTKTVSPAEQLEQQSADFAKLFHSSMVNMDAFARPTIASDTRDESAAKYLGLWATRQVNVNSAPRHVLEAALTFGSAADAPKIAEAIIQQRQIKPFTDIDEVKKEVFRYSDSIDKCKDFLTTTSSVFTIKVTAISGVAKVTAIAAVSKEKDKVKQIGVVSD